jgi:hypothetical protein
MIAKDGTTIYYFGGTSTRTVHKFDSLTNSTVKLPTDLPSGVCFSGGVSMSGTILLFNGSLRKIMEFSEETETASIIGDLLFDNYTGTFPNCNIPLTYTTTAIPDGKDGVWLFAGNWRNPTNPILIFNTTTKDVQSSPANTTSLPTLYSVPASVSYGHYGYLIGGLGKVNESDGSAHPSNGILR